jgi:predicted phosphate transport protein (TIGR00153 family)
MFFWKKERQVRQDVEDYLAETEWCADAFVEGMDAYLSQGPGERFDAAVEEAHRRENAADRKRRQIEASMYDKALIPESRGDVLGMLEAIDLVPNQYESVLYQIWTENPDVPAEYVERYRQLVSPNVEAHRLLCRAMRALFVGAKEIRDLAGQVSHKEAESDRLERMLIKEVFASPMDKADKILLRGLAIRIGEISDRAENAMDRLVIVAAKRQS